MNELNILKLFAKYSIDTLNDVHLRMWLTIHFQCTQASAWPYIMKINRLEPIMLKNLYYSFPNFLNFTHYS